MSTTSAFTVQCSRIPRKKVYFPNSPYNTQLDVGTCMGHCQKGRGCFPHERSYRIFYTLNPKSVYNVYPRRVLDGDISLVNCQ